MVAVFPLSFIILGPVIFHLKNSVSDTYNKNSYINLLSTQCTPGPAMCAGNIGIKGTVSTFKCLTVKLENVIIVKRGK